MRASIGLAKGDACTETDDKERNELLRGGKQVERGIKRTTCTTLLSGGGWTGLRRARKLRVMASWRSEGNAGYWEFELLAVSFEEGPRVSG